MRVLSHQPQSLPPSLPPSTVDPPTISVQPAPQLLIVPGESTSFTITASSQDGILMYQWQKDEDDISGETSATYTISSVAESAEGMYRCVVSNAAGTVNSNAAQLTVCKCVQKECLHISLNPSLPSLPPSLHRGPSHNHRPTSYTVDGCTWTVC